MPFFQIINGIHFTIALYSISCHHTRRVAVPWVSTSSLSRGCWTGGGAWSAGRWPDPWRVPTVTRPWGPTTGSEVGRGLNTIIFSPTYLLFLAFCWYCYIFTHLFIVFSILLILLHIWSNNDNSCTWSYLLGLPCPLVARTNSIISNVSHEGLWAL